MLASRAIWLKSIGASKRLISYHCPVPDHAASVTPSFGRALRVNSGVGRRVTAVVRFGCEHCWPPDGAAAWKACSQLTDRVDLIDQSHFHVMTMSCPFCGQGFISVFTELIDWVGGEDSQSWTVLPITEAEVIDLKGNQALPESTLNSLAPSRRIVEHVYPKGQEPSTQWARGIFVRPLD